MSSYPTGSVLNGKDGNHRWKNSWPGNFCLDCGLEDFREDEEYLQTCWYCLGFEISAQNCGVCSGTGYLPRQDLKIPSCPGRP